VGKNNLSPRLPLRSDSKKICHRGKHDCTGNLNSAFCRGDTRAGRQRGGGLLRDGFANKNEIPVLLFEDLRARVAMSAWLAIIFA
jgi:hypothetical protein